MGRPASPTFGGIFTVKLNMFGSDDPTLAEWMVSPIKIMDGKVVLKRIDSNTTLKAIKFYNAYTVGMDIHYDGTANASFFTVTLRISPEQIDIGGLFHDNKWPDESPIRALADDEAALWTPAITGLVDSLTDGLSSLAVVVPPLSKSMDEGKAEPPPDPSRRPDYKPDLLTFDPSRTPDYPSVDKPTLPTVIDRLDTLKEVADWIFSSENQPPRLATPEVAERIRLLKEELKRNSPELLETSDVATVDGIIDEKPTNLIANSSKVTAEGTVKHKHPKDQILKTGPTANDIAKGKTHPNLRAYDSEAKLCEKILDNTTPDSEGEITITSENEPCDSCEDVITRQMKELRPGIKIKIVYTKPYKNK